MSLFEVQRAETSADLSAVLNIRTRVFVDEQHVPPDEEVDRYDVLTAIGEQAIYVLGWLDGTPIATGRLLIDADKDDLPHIGRVAVLREHRGHGFGRAIMTALQAAARARGFAGVTLAAQLQALPFYEHLGYVAHGPAFLDAGIEHRQMDLQFGP